MFMERLWAYKRINYLLADSTECTKAISTHDEVLENTTAFSEEKILLIDLIDNVNKEEEENNDCENEATKLALKYNFVTDLTSLVIEEDDNYINKGPIEIGKKPRPSPAYHASFASYASYGAPAPQPFAKFGGGGGGNSGGFGGPPSSSYGVRSSTSSLSLFASYSKGAGNGKGNGAGNGKGNGAGNGKGNGAGKRNRNRQRPPSPTSRTTTTTQAPSTTTLGYCKITMYEQTYFRGSSVEITGDVSDFNDIAFDNEIASLKIEGDCCWTIFTDSNFQGVSMNLNVGEYQSATNIRDVFKKASSAKTSC